MLDRIKALLSGGGDTDSRTSKSHSVDELHLAAAALLVEAASRDGHFDEVEQQTVETLVRDHFDLDDDEAQDLITAAKDVVEESSQLYGFTRVVKDRFPHEERVRMIEMLWEVAYADGVLHDYEANLVRQVCGLIYVPDRESGMARKRVLARLGLN